MIAVHVRPTAEFTSVMSLDAVWREDCSGLVVHRDEGTNAGDAFSTVTRVSALEPIDRTLQHAVTRYDGLLRRLAD